MKWDKIKALALAKECYAMKLELLTNATVVVDAIRFVASNSARIINKTKSDKMDVDEEDRSHEKQQSIATANSIFSVVRLWA